MYITEILNLYNLHSDPDSLNNQKIRELVAMSDDQFFQKYILPFIEERLGTKDYVVFPRVEYPRNLEYADDMYKMLWPSTEFIANRFDFAKAKEFKKPTVDGWGDMSVDRWQIFDLLTKENKRFPPASLVFVDFFQGHFRYIGGKSAYYMTLDNYKKLVALFRLDKY